jgi:hypothetical protein
VTAVALTAPTVNAATCSVPSATHETIEEAVADIGCTEIELAGQLFIESVSITRSVVLRGQSSTTTLIQGQLTVTGASTAVSLHALTIDGSALPVNGCFDVVLDVTDGGRVTAEDDVVVINSKVESCPIFADGFETGSSSRWSRVISP